MKAHKRRKLGLLENVKEGFTEMILGLSMRMSVSPQGISVYSCLLRGKVETNTMAVSRDNIRGFFVFK